MRIGLTGSIATGKTTVANLLKELGAYVIDADKLAHKALKKSHSTFKKIVEAFGEEILDDKGNIDRKKLGKIVFKDKQKLKLLESIIHPYIRKKRDQVEQSILKKNPKATIVYDVPLLFENGLEKDFDLVVVAYTDKQTQVKRLMARQQITRQEALQLINLQMDIEEKKKRADLVIDNSYSLENTKSQVLLLVAQYI